MCEDHTWVRGRPRSSAKTTLFFCLLLPSLLLRMLLIAREPDERQGLILGGTDLLVIVGAVTTKGLYSNELYTGGLCPRSSSAGIAMEHI